MTFSFRRKPIALLLCYGIAGALVGSYAVDAHAQAAPLRVDPTLLGLPPVTPATAPAPASVPVAKPKSAEPASVEVRPVEAVVVEARPAAIEPEESRAVKTVKPVQPSAPPKVSAQEVPVRPMAPQSAPVVAAKPVPVPLAAGRDLPVLAAPPRTPREEEKPKAAAAPPRQTAKAPEPLPSAPVAASVPPLPVSGVVPAPAATPVPKMSAPAAQQTVAAAAKPFVSTAASSGVAVSQLEPLRVDPALLGQVPAPTVNVPLQAAVSSTMSGRVMPASKRGQGVLEPSPSKSASQVVSSASVPSQSAVSSASSASSGQTKSVPMQSQQTVASDAVKNTSQVQPSWWEYVWDPVANAYNNGTLEFYLPFKTYHSRSTYTQEQIDSYQENPLGFGVGRGLYNEKGNWEGVLALAFQDSHSKPSYTAGYQWRSIWRPAEDFRVGLGYMAGLMARSDVANYVPFPVAFPVASVAYKNLNIEGAYIPKVGDKGNVLFFWAKWELGKPGEAIGTPARHAPTSSDEMVNTSFASATPIAKQSVPYGPALDAGAGSGHGSGLASAAQTKPPLVASAGPRDEEEVPDVLPALALRSAQTMTPLPKDSPVPRPVFLSALRMGGQIDREFVAEEEAELRKVGTVVNADRLTYWPVEDELEAEGNVSLEQGDALVTGPKMRMKLEEQVGFFEQPIYRVKQQTRTATQNTYTAGMTEFRNEDYWNSGFASPRTLDIKPGQTTFKESSGKGGNIMPEVRGEADRIDFEGENQMRLTNGTYTTCEPGNNDWYAKASDLKLDYDREVADGKDGTVYFLDVPIFYSPWLSFSLNRERKSGFLAPSWGTDSDNGIEFALPYYWNIAPNMDATITPRVMSKRGLMLNNELRYLNTAFGGQYSGRATADYLPNDRVSDGKDRYGFSLNHVQTLPNGFSGLINYNKVSDNDYFTDLSSNVSQTSQVNLLQQGVLSYSGSWWSATANFQQYQTLQPDPKNPNLYPYEMMPQFTVNARKPDLFMTDSAFFGQYTDFRISEHLQNGTIYPDGKRTVLYPQVSLPYVTPGWYVTPKIGVNYRNYSLTEQQPGNPGSINVTLPVFSVDSGMTFERTSNWYGRDYTQTLEPRLYYLNIPYEDQSQIPLFDTGRSDFNFAQIFSENQFSGWDRINNANQLTAALTTRLLEPSSGNEIARAMIGQRFYFSRNKVELNPGVSVSSEGNEWEKSDILAAFSGQVLPKVYADSAIEYNLANSEVKRFSLGTRYQPEPGKVLNAAYRYNNDPNAPIDQIDFSGQWPFSGRWSAVGRLNYSFKDEGTDTSTSSQGGRMIQSIAGLEYNGGCWVVRGVFQRLALTQDNVKTSFFIQLELNDFSSIGSNPLKLLQRNISGYSLINQPAADFGLGY